MSPAATKRVICRCLSAVVISALFVLCLNLRLVIESRGYMYEHTSAVHTSSVDTGAASDQLSPPNQPPPSSPLHRDATPSVDNAEGLKPQTPDFLSFLASEDGRVFRPVFNASCVDRVGLPESVARLCALSPSDAACARLTCANLLTGAGGRDVYDLADRFMARHARLQLDDEEVARLAGNCSFFRSERGYADRAGSEEEGAFPIAFTLIVHKDAQQVEGLLRALYQPQNVYCVHVDASAPAPFQGAMRALAACLPNVRLASKSETLTWGGYSRLQADINCMEDHWASGVPWRYLLNTAGQAFPLRTNAELVAVLRAYNGANDIEGIDGAKHRSRYENEFFEDVGKRTVDRTGKKNTPPPHSIDVVKGSSYGVFSREFVRFVLEDARARDLREWTRHTWSPDELLWATLHHTHNNPHLHTPGGYSGVPSNKPWLAVYANWNSNTCHGRVVRSVCVFGMRDLPALIPRKELFLNKFYSDFEPLALECLTAWVRHKQSCPVTFDVDYYRTLAFVKQY